MQLCTGNFLVTCGQCAECVDIRGHFAIFENVMANKSGFVVMALQAPPTTPEAVVNNALCVGCSIKFCVL